MEDYMSKQLLKINGLSVNVEDKEILHGINLEIKKGETHVLMGPNGAGKSTLGYALMGNPRYEVTKGDIWFQGKRINEEPADKRAKAGLFLSFQNPLEVPGLPLGTFIRSAVEQRRGARVRLWDFRKELEKAMELLQMDRAYGDRDLNAGFSGGEKKKAEILQLLLLNPSLAILDGFRSGRGCGTNRVPGRGRVPEGPGRRSSDYHPQHPDSGVPACGQNPHYGRRQNREDRRRFPGGTD